MGLSIEKVVALLTPLVFAPASALVTKLIAVNLPGLHVTSGQLMALMITAFTGAVGMAAHWLQGQKEWRKLTAGFAALPTPVHDEIVQTVQSLADQVAAMSAQPYIPDVPSQPESAVTPDQPAPGSSSPTPDVPQPPVA